MLIYTFPQIADINSMNGQLNYPLDSPALTF